MRIVAGGDTFLNPYLFKQQIEEIGEGIVLFSCMAFGTGKQWTKEELAEFTKNMPMTIVGGESLFEMDGDQPVADLGSKVYIIRHGQIIPAQMDAGDFEYENIEELLFNPDWFRQDNLHNVSYQPGRKVMALTRLSYDAKIPFLGKGKIDLLLIPTTHNWAAGDERDNDIDRLVKEHERLFTENALIVQCGAHGIRDFIYSVKEGRFVGRRIRANFNKENTSLSMRSKKVFLPLKQAVHYSHCILRNGLPCS